MCLVFVHIYIYIDLCNVILSVNYCVNVFAFVKICGCCRSCPDVITYESLHCFVFFNRLLCLTSSIFKCMYLCVCECMFTE